MRRIFVILTIGIFSCSSASEKKEITIMKEYNNDKLIEKNEILLEDILEALKHIESKVPEIRGNDNMKVNIYQINDLGIELTFLFTNGQKSNGFFIRKNNNSNSLYFGMNMDVNQDYNISSIAYILLVDESFLPVKGLQFSHSFVEFESIFERTNGNIICISELVPKRDKIELNTTLSDFEIIFNNIVVSEKLYNQNLYSDYPFQVWN